MGVEADLVEAELASESLEVGVIGASQGIGEIDVAAAAENDLGVLVPNAFAERGERDRELDGGAGLSTAGESQLLIHHGEDAATGGLNGDDRSIHIAECIDGGLAHDRLFACSAVAFGNVFSEGTGVEALVVAMTAMRAAGRSQLSAGTAAGKMTHPPAGVLAFA